MNFEVNWSLTTLQIVSLGILLNFFDYVKSIASRFFTNSFLDSFILSAVLVGLSMFISYLIIIIGRRVGVFS